MGTLFVLAIIIIGSVTAIYRYRHNRNPGYLLFLPFWCSILWMLVRGSSPASASVALVLMVAALLVRRFYARKTATIREEWEETVRPLRNALDSETLKAHKYDYPAPKDVPYSIIPEIKKPEWDELVRHAKNPAWSHARANEYLWGYLYRLHRWTYIDFAPVTRGGTEPYCGVIGGKPSLLFFTSEDQAREFIVSQRIAERHETVSILSFILPGTLPFIHSFHNNGIQWICFNPGTESSYGGPVELLQDGYWWHMENDERFKSKKV